MKTRFVVSLLNQKLTVQSDASEDYVKGVAAFVEGRIREAMEKTKTASVLTSALLASLNMADEMFNQKEAKKTHLSRIEKRVRELIQSIDTHLQEGSAVL